MIDSKVRHSLIHAAAAAVFVRFDNTIVGFDYVAQKPLECLTSYFLCRLGNDLASGCYCANDRLLFRASITLRQVIIIMLPAPIGRNPGFVSLHNAVQENTVIDHRLTNLHPHSVGCLLRNVQITAQLATRDAFLGIQQNSDSQEPLLQWYTGSFEDRTRQNVVAVVAFVTIPATYTVIFLLASNPVTATKRANWAVSPPGFFQVCNAGFLCRKSLPNPSGIS